MAKVVMFTVIAIFIFVFDFLVREKNLSFSDYKLFSSIGLFVVVGVFMLFYGFVLFLKKKNKTIKQINSESASKKAKIGN